MSGDLQAACQERGWGLEQREPKTCTDGVRTPAGTLPPPLTDTQTICILNVHRHIFSTRAAGAHVGGSRQCSRSASVSQGCRWDSRAAAQLSPTLLLLSSPRTPLTTALPPLVPTTRGRGSAGHPRHCCHGEGAMGSPWAMGTSTAMAELQPVSPPCRAPPRGAPRGCSPPGGVRSWGNEKGRAQ